MASDHILQQIIVTVQIEVRNFCKYFASRIHCNCENYIFKKMRVGSITCVQQQQKTPKCKWEVVLNTESSDEGNL